MIISNINGTGTVTIVPIKAKYSDDTDCTNLSVKATADNFLDSATLQWSLLRNTNSGWQISDSGTITVSGDTYSSWTGDNTSPFLIVAGILGLTITE